MLTFLNAHKSFRTRDSVSTADPAATCWHIPTTARMLPLNNIPHEQNKEVTFKNYGALKTNIGGFCAIYENPAEFCVWNEDYLDGAVNVF